MISEVNLNDAEAVKSILRDAAAAMRASPARTGCAVGLPARGKLLATGDLHDNQEHLRKIITLATLDESPDHHVVLHEIIHGERLINGMDFSYRMLARVAELVLRYPQQVHPILANHEMSQLTGAGVSKGAGNSVELFNDALEYVFGDAWSEVDDAIGEFIRAMPLAVVSAECCVLSAEAGTEHPAPNTPHAAPGLFCAHSLPDEIAMRWFDVNVLDRELTNEDYHGPTGSAYSMVWGRRYSESQIEKLAERWNVKLFCLGHRHVESGAEVFGERAIILNSDHERAAVLPIDLASVPEVGEAMERIVALAAVE